MMMFENMAVLLVFGCAVLGFALGYVTRGRGGGEFRSWAETFAYRNDTGNRRKHYDR